MNGVTRNGQAYATYIYDTHGHLIAEANAATGATTREYLWLPSNDNTNDTIADSILPLHGGGGASAPEGVAPDLPLAVIEGASTYYVHTDHLGRPTRMTDAARATVWQASWKPWGEIENISGTILNNLRFPGQYFQIETNLAYNHHRHYDPVTGSYTQPDPLGFVDGPSVYAYAGNSPWMKTDRKGLTVAGCPPLMPRCRSILEGGGGGAGGGAGGAAAGIGAGALIWEIGREIYDWCLPAATDLPTSGRCKPSEEAYCKGWCGRREVKGCYVTIGWRIKGVRDLGPIRREQRTVNCNCNDD